MGDASFHERLTCDEETGVAEADGFVGDGKLNAAWALVVDRLALLKVPAGIVVLSSCRVSSDSMPGKARRTCRTVLLDRFANDSRASAVFCSPDDSSLSAWTSVFIGESPLNSYLETRKVAVVTPC